MLEVASFILTVLGLIIMGYNSWAIHDVRNRILKKQEIKQLKEIFSLSKDVQKKFGKYSTQQETNLKRIPWRKDAESLNKFITIFNNEQSLIIRMVKIDINEINEIYKKLNGYVKTFIDGGENGDITKIIEISEQIRLVMDSITPKINDIVKKNNVEEIV